MAGLNFRILLDNTEDTEIFRDIQIDEESNLEQFYYAIVDAFGLANDQMASFFVSDGAWNKGEEISLLDMAFGDEISGTPTVMQALKIRERIYAPHQRFILIHDFLAMWIFLIELREVTSESPETPHLLLSVGTIPSNFKQEGNQSIENMRFDSEGGDEYDDFDDSQFENIDDLDI